MAKWSRGRYLADGITTSWLKVKNPAYSQAEGRRELFDRRRTGAPTNDRLDIGSIRRRAPRYACPA